MPIKESAIPIRMTIEFKAKLVAASIAAGEENVSTWARKVFRHACGRDKPKRFRHYEPPKTFDDILYVKLDHALVVAMGDASSALDTDWIKWARGVLAREIGFWS